VTLYYVEYIHGSMRFYTLVRAGSIRELAEKLAEIGNVHVEMVFTESELKRSEWRAARVNELLYELGR